MSIKWIDRKGKEEEVEVRAIHPYGNEKGGSVRIEWSGTNGWGEYTIFVSEDKITADSECMDRNDDKRFLRALFDDIISQVDIKW